MKRVLSIIIACFVVLGLFSRNIELALAGFGDGQDQANSSPYFSASGSVKAVAPPGAPVRLSPGVGGSITYANAGSYLVAIISNPSKYSGEADTKTSASEQFADGFINHNSKTYMNSIGKDVSETLSTLFNNGKFPSAIVGDTRFKGVVVNRNGDTYYSGKILRYAESTGTSDENQVNLSPDNCVVGAWYNDKETYYRDSYGKVELSGGNSIIDLRKHEAFAGKLHKKLKYIVPLKYNSAVWYMTEEDYKRKIDTEINNAAIAFVQSTDGRGLSKKDVEKNMQYVYRYLAVYKLTANIVAKDGEDKSKADKIFNNGNNNGEVSFPVTAVAMPLVGSAYVGEGANGKNATYFCLVQPQQFIYNARNTGGVWEKEKTNELVVANHKLCSNANTELNLSDKLNTFVSLSNNLKKYLDPKLNKNCAYGWFYYYDQKKKKFVAVKSDAKYTMHTQQFYDVGEPGYINIIYTLRIVHNGQSNYGINYITTASVDNDTKSYSYVYPRFISQDYKDVSGYVSASINKNAKVKSKDAKESIGVIEIKLGHSLIQELKNKSNATISLNAKFVDVNVTQKNEVKSVNDKVDSSAFDVSKESPFTLEYPEFDDKSIKKVIGDNGAQYRRLSNSTLKKDRSNKFKATVNVGKILDNYNGKQGIILYYPYSLKSLNDNGITKSKSKYIAVEVRADVEGTKLNVTELVKNGTKVISAEDSYNKNLFTKDSKGKFVYGKTVSMASDFKDTGKVWNFITLTKSRDVSGTLALNPKRAEFYKEKGKDNNVLVKWNYKVNHLSEASINSFTNRSGAKYKIYLSTRLNYSDKSNFDKSTFKILSVPNKVLAGIVEWNDYYVKKKPLKRKVMKSKLMIDNFVKAFNKDLPAFTKSKKTEAIENIPNMHSISLSKEELKLFLSGGVDFDFQTDCKLNDNALKIEKRKAKLSSGGSKDKYLVNINFNNALRTSLIVESDKGGAKDYIVFTSDNTPEDKGKEFAVRKGGKVYSASAGKYVSIKEDVSADIMGSATTTKDVVANASVGVNVKDEENPPPPTKVPEPFSYHSTLTPDVFSELKANEPRNEDWNVLGGVPSTERLFVANGGKQFHVDVAGVTNWQENIERKITFKFNIVNSWGSNEPDQLSGTEHLIWSGGESISVSANGPSGYSQKTAKDGVTITATGYTASEGTPPKTVNKSSSANYSWSLKLLFDDSNGKFKFEGNHGSGGGSGIYTVGTAPKATCTKPKKINKWGQAYFMTGPSTITKGSFSDTSSVVPEQALVNHGYTVGLGSVHSERTNAFHRTTETEEISFTEKIPIIFYLNIRNYAIHGLYKSELTNFDNTLFETNGSNVVGQQLQAMVYNIIGDGRYQSGNGRLWFTKPPEENFKVGAGWKETTNSYAYWTGDWVVNITTNPDFKYGLNNNNKLHNNGVRLNAGCDDDGGSATGGPSNKWHGFGSELTSLSKNEFASQVVEGDATTYPNNEKKKFASAVANAWMNRNNTLYTATVISDSMSIGSLDNPERYQDIVSSIYQIDNGIKLFEKPFNNGSREAAEHKDAPNIMGKDQLRGDGIDNNYQTVFSPEDITFDGYKGIISADYDDKYRTVGSVEGLTETKEPLINALRDEELLMRRFIKSPKTKWYYAAPNFKAGGNTSYAYCNPEFVSECKIVEAGSTGGETHEGYYENYNLTGAKTATMIVNKTGNHLGKQSPIPGVTAITTNNSALVNMQKYGFALAHTGLKLLEKARNGKYISPVESKLVYGSMLENYEDAIGSNEEAGKEWVNDRQWQYEGEYVKNFTNENGVIHKINSLVIHDPISTEYCKVINYPSQVLTGNHLAEYDLRETGQKLASNSKFALIGDTMEIFYSDVGNFHDNAGQAAQLYISNERAVGNSNQHWTTQRPSKEVVVPRLPETKDPNTAGYSNSMVTTRWAENRYIQVPFPCYTFDKNGNKRTYGANELIDVKDLGGECIKEASMVKEDTTDKGVPGWVIKLFVLTSADELKGANVSFITTAINKPEEFKDTLETINAENNMSRMNYAAHHDCFGVEPIDVVGRLGNLSITDTEDFRFSNLFRRTLPEWDIPGVIRKTDLDTPNQVAADWLDILMNSASDKTMGHTTEGMTFFKPYNSNYTNLLTQGIAKSNGNFTTLPLTPAKNNIPEYRREPMRMGYQLFLDIETIGNYYGQGATADERQSSIRGIDIVPHYVFYDIDTKEYIPIDIYFGSKTKELIYKYGSSDIDRIKYEINTADEYGRRNIKEMETDTTDKILNIFGASVGTRKYNSAKVDAIGHVGKIELDQFNRDFIGSSVLYSGVDYKNNLPAIVAKAPNADEQVTQNKPWRYDFKDVDRKLINEEDFQKQNQRWFWKLGLASSSIIVPHGDIPPGESIESVNKKFRRDHRNGFVLNGVSIKSKGDVWNLEYNGEFINNGWIDYDVPEKPGDPNPPTLIRKVPGPKIVKGLDWRRLAWIVAYNPWNTSTDDKDIKGTH